MVIASRIFLREEESKLLKRHPHKPKKTYVIECRAPNCGIPAFTRWHFSGRYETETQRDQVLHDLRKTADTSGLLLIEYPASAGR